MQKAACQLKVPFGAMHPDWLLMLDVLYMLITSQPFPADEVIAAQPFMPAEIGHDVAFLESNKAAQTTAAALFCFLQQLHGKQDTQGERELDSLDVRSMDEVLKTMHTMLTVGFWPCSVFAVHTVLGRCRVLQDMPCATFLP